MEHKLHFTAAAKVIALLSIAVGVLLLVLGIAGLSGSSSTYGTRKPWEAFPEFYLGAGLSGVVSGVIIGVLYEISRSVAARLPTTEAEPMTQRAEPAATAPGAASVDKRSSDPAYKYIAK